VQPKPYTQALAELTDVLGRSGESNLSGSEYTLSPGSEEVLRQAAQLAEENGWASAAARLEVAHEQEPRNPGIAAGLGLSYCALGKRSEALPLIDMGIKFFSTFPESTALLPESTPLLSDYLALLWVQKSVCLSALNRTTDALLAIERALYADPEGQYAYILWLVKAKAFQEANDLSKARNAYLTAIKYRQQAKPEFLSAPDIANLEKEFDTMFAH
jgi:tetratricopeptide (TPR) repeat protein